MPSSHLILCHPLLLLPSMFPSIGFFSNESALHIRWPKYWSFSFSISPSNEHPGLISFRMDWLNLLATQGTLKSLFQHHSSKASILWLSAFCIVQLSHPYMTTGKTTALTSSWTTTTRLRPLQTLAATEGKKSRRTGADASIPAFSEPCALKLKSYIYKSSAEDALGRRPRSLTRRKREPHI